MSWVGLDQPKKKMTCPQCYQQEFVLTPIFTKFHHIYSIQLQKPCINNNLFLKTVHIRSIISKILAWSRSPRYVVRYKYNSCHEGRNKLRVHLIPRYNNPTEVCHSLYVCIESNRTYQIRTVWQTRVIKSHTRQTRLVNRSRELLQIQYKTT